METTTINTPQPTLTSPTIPPAPIPAYPPAPRKRKGNYKKPIPQELWDAVIHWHREGLPLKYNAIVSGTTLHYVKRILREAGLYEVDKYSSNISKSEGAE
jgi:hypothetical protein